MVAYTRAQIERLLKVEFIRFCIVGGVGFVINFAILIGLSNGLHAPIVLAQLIGAEIALGSNFVLHHNWTYKGHNVKKSLKSLIIQFHATSWPAILGSTAMVSLGVDVFHLSKVISLVVSSVVALMWNFWWSKFVIWRKVTPKDIEEIAS